MAIATPIQIATYAYNAGFRGADLITAVAIALAESSGNTDIYNPETQAGTPTGEGSRGLWQIYGEAHPEYDSDAVYDPQTNANAAYSIYASEGNSFTPWSTFNNNEYKQYQPQATQSVSNVASGGTNGSSTFNEGLPIPSIPNPLPSIGSGLSALGTTLNWIANPGRLAKFVIGVVLIFTGIYIVVHPDVQQVDEIVDVAKGAGEDAATAE